MITMKKLFLGYTCNHAFLRIGFHCGHAIKFYDDGSVEMETYKCGIDANRKFENIIDTSSTASIPIEVAHELKQYMLNHAYVINALESETCNFSVDGWFDRFNFMGKKTSSLNISIHDPSTFCESFKNPLENDPILQDALEDERRILAVFEGAYRILKKHNVPFEASISSHFSCKWTGE